MFKNKDQFIAYTAARVLAGQAANPEKIATLGLL